MNHNDLPWRKNCEGYLIIENGEIVVRDTGKGYLEFPGGGVDESESPEKALAREAFEEAGVVLKGPLTRVKVLHFLWGPDWAKTEKQKKRYEQFKGEEMYFFKGHVKELIAPKGDGTESGWTGKRTMKIRDAIESIENSRPFSKEMREYRELQLSILRSLQ